VQKVRSLRLVLRAAFARVDGVSAGHADWTLMPTSTAGPESVRTTPSSVLRILGVLGLGPPSFPREPRVYLPANFSHCRDKQIPHGCSCFPAGDELTSGFPINGPVRLRLPDEPTGSPSASCSTSPSLLTRRQRFCRCILPRPTSGLQHNIPTSCC
jgi:hypothetical protein